MPKTPPLVMDSSWLASVFGSSSSSGPRLAGAPREAELAPGAAPAPSPLLRGGALLHALPAALEAEDEAGRVLRDVAGASGGGELVSVPDVLVRAFANIIGQITLSKRLFDTQGDEANRYSQNAMHG